MFLAKAIATVFRCKLQLTLFILLGLLANSLFAEVQRVRYWDWGATPSRDDYEIAVLQAILEATKPEFGDYKLERVLARFTTKRVRRELLRGKFINVQPGPWRNLDDVPPAERPLRIDIDFYKGLLGYRRLFVANKNLAKYQFIPSETELKKLTNGQVKGWIDSDIYLANGYKVNSDANLGNLFEMLRFGRFDYVAMSAAEEATLLTPERAQNFSAVHGLLVYYVFPMVFYVTPTDKTLGERVQRGMEIITGNGQLDKLFNSHYQKLLQQLRAESPIIYRLDNPTISDSAKQLIKQELL